MEEKQVETEIEDANRRLVLSWIEDVLRKSAKTTEEWIGYARLKAPDYWSENYTAHHDPSARGREGLLDRLTMLSTAFSDTEVEVLLLIAKGDMVADSLRIAASHTGHFLGVPPSGKRVSWLQNEIFRLKNGRIIEGWVTRDWLGLLKQLSAPGGTGSPPATK